MEEVFEFFFGLFKNFLSFGGEVFAGAIDIKIEHGHGRLVGGAFASWANFGRAFERKGDVFGVFPGEDAFFQV